MCISQTKSKSVNEVIFKNQNTILQIKVDLLTAVDELTTCSEQHTVGSYQVESIPS